MSPKVGVNFVAREPVEEMVLLKRLAECHEIANVAAFLVSDAASCVHGPDELPAPCIQTDMYPNRDLRGDHL